jgi:hypothetical protein
VVLGFLVVWSVVRLMGIEAWLDYSEHLKCVMLFLCPKGSTSTSVSKD